MSALLAFTLKVIVGFLTAALGLVVLILIVAAADVLVQALLLPTWKYIRSIKGSQNGKRN